MGHDQGSNIAQSLTEADLQAAIADLAVVLGWRSYHTFDSRRSNAGFPDLVLYQHHRLIFAELKSARGKLSAEQEATLDALMLTPAEVYVWRPKDWFSGRIEMILKDGEPIGIPDSILNEGVPI